jgi:hypothetical protein
MENIMTVMKGVMMSWPTSFAGSGMLTCWIFLRLMSLNTLKKHIKLSLSIIA